MRPFHVALIGLGTVGTGVAKLLVEHADRNARRAGRSIVLKHVIVRDAQRRRGVALVNGLLHSDVAHAIEDPEVDAIVEVMGGTDLARRHLLAALNAGKDVVTANKALLCVHGDEIFAAAKRNGRTVCFEAAVAGGVPVIAGVGQSLSGNQITGIEAILNGTSNYILTQMSATGSAFDDVVKEAQALGYAEADPTMDIDGTDAAQKLAILVRIAFGTKVQPADFVRQGIDTLEASDLAYAAELGYAVKLLARAKLTGGKLELHVQPTLVRRDRPLAQVDGARNMIAVDGDAVGTVWWSGPGAGQMATASAVVADVIDLAVGRAQRTFPQLDLWGDGAPVPLLPIENIRRRSYFRFNVEDRPHVVADIADVLGRHEISLASIIQHEAPDLGEADDPPQEMHPIVPLVVMTHRATEGQVRAAEAEFARLSALRGPWVRMPVAD
ncbi:MAG: homoserine dehydrogenase [Planctomycetota bacterium]|nr:homoserine dehydrogenase [Planctomycetaceae bacterium]MDQ3329606.1 homoserine dehydrogenase [Planctomycetota bacterium]